MVAAFRQSARILVSAEPFGTFTGTLQIAAHQGVMHFAGPVQMGIHVRLDGRHAGWAVATRKGEERQHSKGGTAGERSEETVHGGYPPFGAPWGRSLEM